MQYLSRKYLLGKPEKGGNTCKMYTWRLKRGGVRRSRSERGGGRREKNSENHIFLNQSVAKTLVKQIRENLSYPHNLRSQHFTFVNTDKTDFTDSRGSIPSKKFNYALICQFAPEVRSLLGAFGNL